MGMFDTIYLNIKCPNCGIQHDVDVQTKSLECGLFEYRKGDKVPYDLTQVLAIGECRSKWHKGDPYFYIKVSIKDKRITGEYEIIKDEKSYYHK